MFMQPKYGPAASFSALPHCVVSRTTSARCFDTPAAATIGLHRVLLTGAWTMAKKAKRFRIGVEGATTDGRTIERSWLEQMAANYSPELYTAVINMEHIKGYTPDSPFRRFGVVEALDAEEISDGPLKGKLGLYALINPTDELVTLTGTMQKIFTSMEIRPEFADTGAAYLIGLAVTDDPASLGTEMLQFSASAGANPLANR